jgi:hypothetical protein
MRVRIIKERYDLDGNVELDPRNGLPKVNGGAFRFTDPKTRQVTDFFPGEVIEMPDAIARKEIANAPHILEPESAHVERMSLIQARQPDREAQRNAYAARMAMLEAQVVQSQKLQAMAEEKARERAAANILAAQAAKESGGKDAQLEMLLRKITELEARLSAAPAPAADPVSADKPIDPPAEKSPRKKAGG